MSRNPVRRPKSLILYKFVIILSFIFHLNWTSMFPITKLVSSLAYSEIYVTVAKLFGNFELQLFDTDFDDIKQVHDFFSPFPESDKGLRVTVL